MKVSMISEQDWDEFDRFVKAQPNSSLYHTIEWKNILEATFGYKARFLVARSDSDIIDVLPLYLVSLLKVRKKLVCIPLSGTYSAFLSENSAAHSLLIDAAVELARKEGVQYLEIRSNTRHDAFAGRDFIERHPFYFSQLEIKNTAANKKLLTHGHKLSITRAGKRGVSVELSTDKDDLRKLYAVMEEMYREFGTPLFSYCYLANMRETLGAGGSFLLFLIKRDGRIIGGGCNLLYGDTMIFKYGTYLPSERALCPFHALHWNAIEECIRRGLRYADLGATSAGDKGLRQFKRNWGAVENSGFFYYLPVKGKPPEMNTYLDSFQVIKKIWRHLPKPLLRIVGSQIYKWVC